MSSTTNNPVDNLLTFCTPSVYKKQLDEATNNPLKINDNGKTREARILKAKKVACFACTVIGLLALFAALIVGAYLMVVVPPNMSLGIFWAATLSPLAVAFISFSFSDYFALEVGYRGQ